MANFFKFFPQVQSKFKTLFSILEVNIRKAKMSDTQYKFIVYFSHFTPTNMTLKTMYLFLYAYIKVCYIVLPVLPIKYI
jgi:hypothetical protein